VGEDGNLETQALPFVLPGQLSVLLSFGVLKYKTGSQNELKGGPFQSTCCDFALGEREVSDSSMALASSKDIAAMSCLTPAWRLTFCPRRSLPMVKGK
jgi:hypothetical protein